MCTPTSGCGAVAAVVLAAAGAALAVVPAGAVAVDDAVEVDDVPVLAGGGPLSASVMHGLVTVDFSPALQTATGLGVAAAVAFATVHGLRAVERWPLAQAGVFEDATRPAANEAAVAASKTPAKTQAMSVNLTPLRPRTRAAMDRSKSNAPLQLLS